MRRVRPTIASKIAKKRALDKIRQPKKQPKTGVFWQKHFYVFLCLSFFLMIVFIFAFLSKTGAQVFQLEVGPQGQGVETKKSGEYQLVGVDVTIDRVYEGGTFIIDRNRYTFGQLKHVLPCGGRGIVIAFPFLIPGDKEGRAALFGGEAFLFPSWTQEFFGYPQDCE